jgi:hypothetical protein
MRSGLFALVILVACAFSSGSSGFSTQSKKPEDELLLYLAIIKKELFVRGASVVFLTDQTLNIKNTPYMREFLDSLKREGNEVPAELLTEFEKLNETSHQLAKEMELPANVVLIDASGVKDYLLRLKESGKEVPKAIAKISFSRIAFNAAQDQALVFVSLYCGPDCASASFMLMKKKDGIWDGDRVGNLVIAALVESSKASGRRGERAMG